MGLLPKYAKGKSVGFDTDEISNDIKDLGSYDSIDEPKSGFFIEGSNNYDHNLRSDAVGEDARSYFRALSPSNQPTLNKNDAKVKYQPQLGTSETIDGRWHNFSGDKGYTPLKQGDKVKVGNATVKVTGAYGLRNLKGRSTQHSRGMDITTSTGKAHALNDGVIESVKLQGTGKVVGTDDKPAAGYYITVKNSDGTRTQYMHLDPMTDTDIKNLTGKAVKRGDEMWGYTKGSGSMTGPHVKVRHYGNSSRYNVDPSQLLNGIPYKFIPNSTGGNMFKYKHGGLLKKI